MPTALTALLLGASVRLMPAVDASVEAGHDLGADPDIRGVVDARVRPTVVAGDGWSLMVDAGIVTWFRENRRDESVVRLSPEQIGYPVAARLRFETEAGHAWGPFAFHRSNHDVDVTDARRNRETIAYEVYGVEWLHATWPLRVAGGLYWDRGTTLEGERQTLPFQHMLAGVEVEARWPIARHLELATRDEIIALRAANHAPPHFDLNLSVEVTAPFAGERGDIRPWVRLQRVEDYRWLGDPARHVVMLGLTLETHTHSGRAPEGRPDERDEDRRED